MLKRFFVIMLAASCMASAPMQDSGGQEAAARRRFELVREISTRHGISGTFLNAQLSSRHELLDTLYRRWLQGLLCGVYGSYSFPRPLFAGRFRADVLAHPDAAMLREIFTESRPEAAAEWDKLSKNPSVLPSEAFLTSFRKFYETHRAEWPQIGEFLKDELQVQVSGRAIDYCNQEPLPNLEISLIRNRRYQVGTGRSNKNGLFSINLPLRFIEAPLMLRASRPELVHEDSLGGFMIHRHDPSSTHHVFTLYPVMTDHALLRGTVVDARTRAPIHGAQLTVFQRQREEIEAPAKGGVILREQKKSYPMGGVQKIATDAKGKILATVAAGHVTMRLEKRGYPPVSYSLPLQGHESEEKWLEMNRENLPVDLTILDPDGKPLPFALVTSGRDVFSAYPDGRFLTSISPAESREFTVTAWGMEPVTVKLQPGKALKQEIRMKMADTGMALRVVDTEGRPLEKAAVLDSPGRNLVQTGPDGQAYFIVNPLAGAQVAVGKPGFMPHVETANFYSHWSYNHPVTAMPDVVLFPESMAAPSFLAPQEGAYLARAQGFPVRVRVPMLWQVNWAPSRITVDGRDVEVTPEAPLTQVLADFPTAGSQTRTIAAEFRCQAGQQRKVFQAALSFQTGLPAGVKAFTVERATDGLMEAVLKLDADSFPSKVLDGLQLRENDETALAYEAVRKGKELTLRAKASAAASHVHVRYHDPQGKPVQIIW